MTMIHREHPSTSFPELVGRRMNVVYLVANAENKSRSDMDLVFPYIDGSFHRFNIRGGVLSWRELGAEVPDFNSFPHVMPGLFPCGDEGFGIRSLVMIRNRITFEFDDASLLWFHGQPGGTLKMGGCWLKVAGIDIEWNPPEQLSRTQEFYRLCGYHGALTDNDRILIVRDVSGTRAPKNNTGILAAVRMLYEDGHLMLRGMNVHKSNQREGIGTALLHRFVAELPDEPCYCIPFGHLEEFYGQEGFRRIEPDSAPRHLQARLAEYQKDNPDMLIMQRG